MTSQQQQAFNLCVNLLRPFPQWSNNLVRLQNAQITVKGSTSLFKNSCTTWSRDWIALANDFFTANWNPDQQRASAILHESVHLFQRDKLGDFGFYWKYAFQRGRFDLEFEAELEQVKCMKALKIWVPSNINNFITGFLSSHQISMSYFNEALIKITNL